MRKKKFDKQILEKAKRVIYYKVRKREMRFSLNTSLLALVFAIGAADVLAAPTVRSLGTGSISSSASAPTSAPNGVTGGTTGGAVSVATGSSSRAGSLRTGGYIGPRATVSTSSSGAADSATQSESTGTAVSSGSAGMNRASSTSPRLSVGSYIGAPHHSISTDGVDIDLSGKVDKFQGKDVKGEALIVGNDGYVTTGEIVTPDQLEIDLSHKVDKDQGTGNAGKALIVDDEGIVQPSDDFVNRFQGGNLENGEYEHAGEALVVGEDGYVTTGDVVTTSEVTNIVNQITQGLETDISGKVDKKQLTGAGKALVVDPADNILKPTGDFVNRFQGGDLENGEYENANMALVVDPTDGNVKPAGDFVNRFQGGDLENGEYKNAGKVLVVNDNGYVTTGRMDLDSLVDDLNLGELAYKDKVKNAEVADDAAIERRKMATDITSTLDWIDQWKNQELDPEAESPESAYQLDPESRYVLAVDEYGQPAWFKVAVE